MKLNVLTAILCASGCVAALTSCDPQAFTMNVEMRYPSSTGISFDGKSVAVVYLDADAARDSDFNEYLANGFATSIEKDYFGGEQAVSLYLNTLCIILFIIFIPHATSFLHKVDKTFSMQIHNRYYARYDCHNHSLCCNNKRNIYAVCHYLCCII